MQSSTPSADTVLRIGTRGSPLALVQARQVQARLAAAHALAPERIAIEIIRTSGDMIRDRPLAEVGGKGLFTKEIEDALLANRVDLAVHSAKDMPTVLPAGLAIVAVLPREDARDVFISRSSRLTSACRRSDAVPTTAPCGRSCKVRLARLMKTSRASSRGSTATIASPAGSTVGMSLAECTARSMRFARSASSISLVNRPLPPTSASGRSRIMSPLVRMISIAMRNTVSADGVEDCTP